MALVVAVAAPSAIAVSKGPARTAHSHTITLNKGIPGASVGDSKSFVKNHLGKSNSVYKANCTASKKCDQQWVYTKAKRYVEFHKNNVLYIIFNSPKDKLTDGIGVGVSSAKVHKSYPACLKGQYSYCFLRGNGTRKNPKGGKTFTYIRTTGETNAQTVQAVIVGVWKPKYEDCMLGCG